MVKETSNNGNEIASFEPNNIKYVIFTATTSVTYFGFGGMNLSNPTIDTPILMYYQDGIENWNWNEIRYFEGMQSVKNPVLTTTNFLKVLGNEEIVNIYNTMGYTNVGAKLSENGKFVLTKNGAFHGPNKVWQLEPNTTYTARIQGEVSFESFYSNAISNVDRGSFNGGIYVKFTTDDTGDFGFLLNFTKGVEVDFNVFYGDVTSKLTEPHKTNTLSCNEEVVLRRIKETSYDTTEITDKLDLINNEYTQRLAEVKPTDDMIIYNDSNDSLITFKINWINFPDIKTEGNIGNGTKVLCNLLPHKYTMADHQIFAHGMNGCFVLCVSKEYGSTEEEIRQWFKDNDLTIIYQLTTPITKKIDLSIVDQDENTLSSMNYFEDGYISIDTETGIIPKLDYTVHSSNYFELSNVIANNNYTLRYDGEPTSMTICGNEITPMNDSIINNGSVKNNILTTNRGVSNLMLISGDVTNEDIEYFKGTRSVEALEVSVHGGVNQPVFGKGGRK